MSELAFLSPDRARGHDLYTPRFASPLTRVLAGSAVVQDLSGLGKIEVRGDVDAIDVDAEVIRITSRRALVLCPYERCAELRAELPGIVIDRSGALAGLEFEGDRDKLRLTDLDLDALPAVGKVADVPALLLRDGSRYRLFFPQEYAHFVGEVVLDVLEGIR